jgi:hypothetical protein
MVFSLSMVFKIPVRTKLDLKIKININNNLKLPKTAFPESGFYKQLVAWQEIAFLNSSVSFPAKEEEQVL